MIEGFGVSRVVHSDNPNFKTGDIVTGMTGWEEYSLIQEPQRLRKIQQDDDIPLSYYVGLLGKKMLSIFLFSKILLPIYMYLEASLGKHVLKNSSSI